MGKIKIVGLTGFILLEFFVWTRASYAQLITVGKDGVVSSNVLSYESDDLGNKEKSVINSVFDLVGKDLPISLTKKDGKLSLNISTDVGEKNFDVTDVDEKIIEFEDRPAVSNLYIAKNDKNFVVGQGSFRAITDFQVNVDPDKAKITLLTPTGYRFLPVPPQEAVNVLVKSKIATRLKELTPMRISEDETGNLYYEIAAVKDIQITDLYTYDAQVTAKISAVNGEILGVEETIWTKILSFFFT
ncbi:MAG TPA: hypothetical protein VI819_03250 [Patescibacteria group bacterium]|nr:hypothetical protein [Patescibacteria group bacterium]